MVFYTNVEFLPYSRLPMIKNFLSALLYSIFKISFFRRKDLMFTLMVLKKENQIYKRQLNHKKVHNSLKRSERFFLTLIFKLSRRAINHLTIVKPSTILNWQHRFVKDFWTYKHKRPGRKPIPKDIKELILELKSRRIVQWNMTENSCIEFVKQRIELFSEGFERQKITDS